MCSSSPKKRANAHAGRAGADAAHITSNIILTGRANAMHQAITDRVHTNFVKNIQTLRVEVMLYADYVTLSDKADMKSHFKPLPLCAKLKNGGFGPDEYVAELCHMTTTGQKLGKPRADVIGLLAGTGNTYSNHSNEAVPISHAFSPRA